MSDLQSLFTDCLNETLIRVILSNPSSKDGVIKICARPMLKNKSLLFQIEEYTKTQVFHKNLTAGDAGSYLTGKLSSDTSSQTASFKCTRRNKELYRQCSCEQKRNHYY